MRIGIDARLWGPTKTGIGRYVSELVTHLEEVDHENEYLIFLRKEDFSNVFLSNPNFKKRIADFPIYSIEEQIKFPWILNSENLDLLHVPHFNIPVFYFGKTVVTIHDMIKHHFHSSQTTTKGPIVFWISQLIYYFVFSQAIIRSKFVLTPSNYVKREILVAYHQDEKKVAVTYEAPADDLKKMARRSMSPLKVANILKKYRVSKPYLLYIGNLYPHKNIDRLIKAMDQIAKVRLVVVTARNIFLRRVRERFGALKSFRRVKFIGFVPDGDLQYFFRGAEAFVFPSLSEGFGLPGIEAQIFGVPVIASSTTSLPEIYGDSAWYFNPLDEDDIAQKINQVLTDEELRNRLRARGKARAKNFSWEKTARETLEVYNEACNYS